MYITSESYKIWKQEIEKKKKGSSAGINVYYLCWLSFLSMHCGYSMALFKYMYTHKIPIDSTLIGCFTISSS